MLWPMLYSKADFNLKFILYAWLNKEETSLDSVQIVSATSSFENYTVSFGVSIKIV